MPKGKSKIIELGNLNIEKLEDSEPEEKPEEKPQKLTKSATSREFKECLMYDPKSQKIKTILKPRTKQTFKDYDKKLEQLKKAREVRSQNMKEKKEQKEILKTQLKGTKQQEKQSLPVIQEQPKTEDMRTQIRDIIRSEMLSIVPQVKPHRRRERHITTDTETDSTIDIKPARHKPTHRKPVEIPRQEQAPNKAVEISSRLLNKSTYNPMEDLFGQH